MADTNQLIARALLYRSENFGSHKVGYAVIGDLTDALEASTRREREMREALAEITSERDLLQEILDTRPAINAGLPESYIRWSQAIYSGEAYRAVAQSQEGL